MDGHGRVIPSLKATHLPSLPSSSLCFSKSASSISHTTPLNIYAHRPIGQAAIPYSTPPYHLSPVSHALYASPYRQELSPTQQWTHSISAPPFSRVSSSDTLRPNGHPSRTVRGYPRASQTSGEIDGIISSVVYSRQSVPGLFSPFLANRER